MYNHHKLVILVCMSLCIKYPRVQIEFPLFERAIIKLETIASLSKPNQRIFVVRKAENT